MEEWIEKTNPPVFFGAAGLVVAIILFGGIWTSLAGRVFNAVLAFIGENFDWYYVLCVTFILLFVIWLFFSRYGKVRLGGEDSRPEFSTFSWFSMLFAAGMGMGLVFWGVAEPVYHYISPPLADGGSARAVQESMRFTFFHWGLHPWAVYIVFGVGIAYFHFRHDLPLAPRSLLYPILGKWTWGWAGHFVDIFCTVGTLLGVATSLGLGAMQINAGLERLVGLDNDATVQVIIVVLITLVATTSTVSGVARGIRLLSVVNVVLALALLLFVFSFGPTQYILRLFATSLGNYVQHLFETSLWVDLRPGVDWQKNWTIFYWGWWISWCPFVGIFVARISRGRTIREFIFYVLLVPTLVTFFWLAAFGGTALNIEFLGAGGIAETVQQNVALSLNALLERLPFPWVTQWLGILLVVIFFITSSDSGSLVDDMVTSGGHPHPPLMQRAFWGISEGAMAAVLLLAGGLKALQAASISAGLPQSFILLAACYSLARALKADMAGEAVVKDDVRPDRFRYENGTDDS